jgi:tetratricopeptide (TPR) repeat protein
MNQLLQYRQDKALWEALQFHPLEDDERGIHDRHERPRNQVLLALQYDRKDSDIEFIRFLFEQEIAAREQDSFQGIGSLDLAAYLLAGFKDVKDIPLFAQAKFANFDTGCGFSLEYIFVACREQTGEYLAAHHPDLIAELKEYLGDLNIPEYFDDWWEQLEATYPDAEEKEGLLALYDRSLALDLPEKAADYLERWIAEEPESSNKLTTMQYHYAELGNYEKAAAAAHKLFEQRETAWDRASDASGLVELYRQAGDFDAAIAMVRELDVIFAGFTNWMGIGLGRIAIHHAFELALEHPDRDAAQSIFIIADNWFGKSVRSNNLAANLAWVGLDAGARAAERCGLTTDAARYTALANQERTRIDAQ